MVARARTYPLIKTLVAAVMTDKGQFKRERLINDNQASDRLRFWIRWEGTGRF